MLVFQQKNAIKRVDSEFYTLARDVFFSCLFYRRKLTFKAVSFGIDETSQICRIPAVIIVLFYGNRPFSRCPLENGKKS